MSPVDIIRKNKDNSYTAIEVLYSYGLDNLASNIESNYFAPNRKNVNTVSKLMSLGTIDRLGWSQKASPLIKKYGYDFDANPKFRALPIDKQVELAKKETQEQDENANYTNSLYIYNHDKQEAPMHIEKGGLYKFCKDAIDANYFILIRNNNWYILTFNDKKQAELESVDDYYMKSIS